MDQRADPRGFASLHAALVELGPASVRAVYAPGLRAMAAVVRKRARTRNYGFRDDTGDLRRSIIVRPLPGRYGGRRFSTARAQVIFGGPGARQAHLVELGHRGPQPAPAHPTLRRAIFETRREQFAAFTAKARTRFPIAVERAARKGRAVGRGR